MNDEDEPLTSQQWLNKILAEQQKTILLLGKESPGKKIKGKQIEYESLLLEKNANTTNPYNTAHLNKSKNNNDKSSYKNINMWSSRSVTLEKIMKPLINEEIIHNWPDFETLSRISSHQHIKFHTSTASNTSNDGNNTIEVNSTNIGVINTLQVRVEEALEVRYSIDHIHNPRSYQTNTSQLVKVRYN